MFKWLKKTAEKADVAIDETKKQVAETANKAKIVLDESGKNVKRIMMAAGVVVVLQSIVTAVAIFKLRSNKTQEIIVKIDSESLK